MNNLRSIVVGFGLAVGAILLITWGNSPVAAQGDTPKALQKWQYRSVSGEGTDEFNQLGTEGWELCVSVSPPSPSHRPTFIFKRPIR